MSRNGAKIMNTGGNTKYVQGTDVNIDMFIGNNNQLYNRNSDQWVQKVRKTSSTGNSLVHITLFVYLDWG